MFNLSRIQLALFLIAAVLVVLSVSGGGRLHFTDETALITLALTAFITLPIMQERKPERKKAKFLLKNFFTSPEGWAVLFLGFSWLNVLWSSSPYVSFQFALQISVWVGVFLLISKLKLTSAETKTLLRFLGIGVMAVSVWTLWQYLSGEDARLSGSFYTANAFAGWLLLALGVVSANIFLSRKLIEKTGWLTGAAFILFLIFASGSRGAFLSLLIGTFFFTIVFLLKKKARAAGAGLMLVLIVFLISGKSASLRGSDATYERLVPNLLENNQVTDQSVSARIEFWQGAWELFKLKPFLGFGLDTFRFHLPLVQKTPYIYSIYAHNFYLQLLAEGGILLALPLIILLTLIARQVWIKLRRDKTGAGTAITASLIMALVHSGLDIDWYFLANPFLFWLMAALIIKQNENSTIKKPVGSSPSRITTSLATATLMIITIWGSVSVFSEYFYERGSLFITLNKPANAIYSFNQASRIITSPAIERGLALGYFTKNQFVQNADEIYKALESANRALEQEPDNSLNYELQGRILLADKRYPEARNSFRRALELDPNNHLTYYALLGQADLLMGRLAEAELIQQAGERVYQKALKAGARFQERISGEAAELSFLNALVEGAKQNRQAMEAALLETLKRNPLHKQAKALLKTLNQPSMGK